MNVRVYAAVVWMAGATSACAHSPSMAEPALARMDGVRVSPGAREGQALAPQAFAHAEEERQRALAAKDQGDDSASALHAERAIAAYQHALILARLARATLAGAAATADLQKQTEQDRILAASRADVDRDADELGTQLEIAREAILPVASGPADPARQRARVVAASSLAMQGRLLCGAARLISASTPELGQADKDVADVEAALATPSRAAGATSAIDAAARARAECLAVLTRARRTADAPKAADPDTLLAELSATGGWDPTRDERGVVVVLRSVFKGQALDPDMEKRLRDLGRVAVAHPDFAVQVVVHDAAPPSPRDAATDTERAQAVVAALVAGGAPAAKVKAETAGAKAPVVDPADAKHRGRNARVEIVFVAPRA